VVAHYILRGIEMLEFEMTREKIPCLYELSFEKGEPPVLQIRIHNDFLEINKGIVPTQAVLEYIKKEHKLNEFLPFGGDYFGFDKALKKGETKGEFTEFDIEIPVLKKETNEICEHCGGKGWDEYFQRPCSWCDGSKHKILYDWKPLTAISASLQLLTSMTEIFDKKISAENNQLLTFQLICGKDMGGFPIGGAYGIDFCGWLDSFPAHYQFDQVIHAMAEVHAHIYKSEVDFWDFQAYVEESAWLIINCPGDACGLHPSDSYRKPGEGRNFSCHNLDNAIQQIDLLIGLAVLSDEARKEI